MLKFDSIYNSFNTETENDWLQAYILNMQF